jgi:hypothetical protein
MPNYISYCQLVLKYLSGDATKICLFGTASQKVEPYQSISVPVLASTGSTLVHFPKMIPSLHSLRLKEAFHTLIDCLMIDDKISRTS